MECDRPIWLEATSDRHAQYVACGKCYPCLQSRRNVWTYRMMKENKDAESGYFVTLTYDPEELPLVDQWGFSVASLAKIDLTLFIKRLRERILRDLPKNEENMIYLKKNEKSGRWTSKIRYFACGEYGKKGDRPHYHLILWNFPKHFIDFDPIHNKLYSEMIDETWNKGIVDIGTVTQASCHYVAKYTLDPLIQEWRNLEFRQKPFAVMSRKPGIGFNYVTDELKRHYHNNKNSYAPVSGGYKQSLGRYLKEKIYQDNVEALRENKYRSIRESEEQAEKEYKKAIGTKQGIEAEEAFISYKNKKSKYNDRKIKSITKTKQL